MGSNNKFPKTGIMAVGMTPINFSVWPYTLAELDVAKHTSDLPKEKNYTVNIDFMHMGVGGINSWGPDGRPLPEYRIPTKEYSFKLVLRPWSSDMGSMEDIARKLPPMIE